MLWLRDLFYVVYQTLEHFYSQICLTFMIFMCLLLSSHCFHTALYLFPLVPTWLGQLVVLINITYQQQQLLPFPVCMWGIRYLSIYMLIICTIFNILSSIFSNPSWSFHLPFWFNFIFFVLAPLRDQFCFQHGSDLYVAYLLHFLTAVELFLCFLYMSFCCSLIWNLPSLVLLLGIHMHILS